jgi:hypothetical protein
MDFEKKVRGLLAAPDSKGKRFFLKRVRKILRTEHAHKAATEAGLYDIYGLYSALCDLSEHIMADRGKTKYRGPAVFWTSNEARRSASDIVAVIRRNTGFDLMDPVASLQRMQRRSNAVAA